jgi:hypothetical protein
MASVAVKPIIDHRCHCGANGAFGYLVDGSWKWFCREHRLRQWSADACRNEADRNAARDVLLGVADDTPPSLQALIAEHGGYDRISAEAWAEYDAAIASWQTRRREKYRRK